MIEHERRRLLPRRQPEKGIDHRADLGAPAGRVCRSTIEIDAALHVTAHGLAQPLRIVVEAGLGYRVPSAVARIAPLKPLPTPFPLSGSSATAASPTAIDRDVQGVIARRGIAAKPAGSPTISSTRADVTRECASSARRSAHGSTIWPEKTA